NNNNKMTDTTATPTIPTPTYEKRDYTLAEITQYDGTSADKPIFVSVGGIIFDVTEKRDLYGVGGGYHVFAGHDVTKCLGKNNLDPTCLDQPDTSSYDEKELGLVEKWAKFYQNKYTVVGNLI
ncbi:hypothetical protein SAMD00019534_101850, partial [Acytostelium subglobosum LB1]|uniref:hypothetical protein n=1 Tax=Acytostelium subglobosum LB1 TaxID=1410327 RepID=UPI000644BE70